MRRVERVSGNDIKYSASDGAIRAHENGSSHGAIDDISESGSYGMNTPGIPATTSKIAATTSNTMSKVSTVSIHKIPHSTNHLLLSARSIAMVINAYGRLQY